MQATGHGQRPHTTLVSDSSKRRSSDGAHMRIGGLRGRERVSVLRGGGLLPKGPGTNVTLGGSVGRARRAFEETMKSRGLKSLRQLPRRPPSPPGGGRRSTHEDCYQGRCRRHLDAIFVAVSHTDTRWAAQMALELSQANRRGGWSTSRNGTTTSGWHSVWCERTACTRLREHHRPPGWY